MKKPSTILVTGASGLIGYGILKSLRAASKSYNLIGTTIYEDSVANAFCDQFVKAIPTHDSNYANWINKTLANYDIDLVIPGFEDDVRACKNNYSIFQKNKTKIVLNNFNLIELCNDKWRFYETLKYVKFENLIPSSLSTNFEALAEEFGLPFLLKPRSGSESKGIIQINERKLFKEYQKLIGKKYFIQPIVGNDDEEYTTSAFGDGNGGFHTIFTLRRKLAKLGYTEKAEVVDYIPIEQVVKKLCMIFKPIGPTNFQFRVQSGNCYLLEINPRFSSATSIRCAFGYNEAQMAAEYYLENIIPEKPVIQYGRAVRYIDEKIFYS